MINPDEKSERIERIKALSTSTYQDVLIYDEKTGGASIMGRRLTRRVPVVCRRGDRMLSSVRLMSRTMNNKMNIFF